MSEPTKLGFLSLEFVVGDDTYWLTTGLGRPDFTFTVLPRALFGAAELRPMFVSREQDYSEITAVELDGKRGLIFAASQHGMSDHLDIAYDAFLAYPTLSWSETAARLMDAIPLGDQMGLWHNHVVRKRPEADLQIADVNYLVTAFLPDHERFAVRGEDWGPGNPNWLTMECPTEDEFKRRLRQFSVVAIRFGKEFYTVS